MKIGTTFSYRECQILGIDPGETLRAIIKLGLNPIRIGTYWDDLEPQKGKYDFSPLDWQIEMLARARIDIVLEVGMKAPRWPEYYFPSWFEVRNVNDESIRPPLFLFIEKVVKKYADHSFVKWINVENEPLNDSGPQGQRIDLSILEKEVSLVRSLVEKPIILNSWLEMHPLKRFWRRLEKRERAVKNCLNLGDILGISTYLRFPGQLKVKDKHWQFLKKILEEGEKKGKEVWVTEMQAEPWEKSDDLKKFSDPDGNSSCHPNDIILYFKKLEALGFKTILFWGAEFWYRCLKENNEGWWQVVRELVNKA